MKNIKSSFIILLKNILKNVDDSLLNIEKRGVSEKNDKIILNGLLFSESEAELNNEDSKYLNKEEILLLAKTFNTPDRENSSEAWAKICDRIVNSKKTIELPNNNKKLIRYGISIAASILLLVSTAIFLLNRNTTIVCPRGKQIAYVLPDSSEIILNSETKIVYKKLKYNWARKIELDGEAFFKVRKGKRFEVYSNNSIVTVVGTSFNVYSREDELKVSCLTGKVIVTLPAQNESKILLPNFETKKNKGNGLSKPSKFNKDDGPMWQMGKFVFSQVPLSMVLLELERQFNVNIKCPQCENRYYTGHFYNKDLKEALIMVCVPMQLNFKLENNNTVLLISKTDQLK